MVDPGYGGGGPGYGGGGGGGGGGGAVILFGGVVKLICPLCKTGPLPGIPVLINL